MLHLNYPGKIPAEDLVGRVMGPDTGGGFTVVTAAAYQADANQTRAELRPMAPSEAAAVQLDAFGQLRLAGARP